MKRAISPSPTIDLMSVAVISCSRTATLCEKENLNYICTIKNYFVCL